MLCERPFKEKDGLEDRINGLYFPGPGLSFPGDVAICVRLPMENEGLEERSKGLYLPGPGLSLPTSRSSLDLPLIVHFGEEERRATSLARATL